MIILLKNIATVQIGYSFRTGLNTCPEGSIAVIQMKDITEENQIDRRNLRYVYLKEVQEVHLLKKDDLIFRTRGQRFNAAILNEDIGLAVASAPLVRIRITAQNVLPKYIQWFLDQKIAQAHFSSRIEGTALKMLNINSLENLELEIPSLNKQRMIIEMAQLMKEEQNLLKLIAQKKKKYFMDLLLQVAKGE
ncbi:MAG: restriction endonuclease subunit S [Candidatus Omnitrophica bacterium]|nr:restriction endonuclease subunit S [Candidatus Omnitrophota bacterium]